MDKEKSIETANLSKNTYNNGNININTCYDSYTYYTYPMRCMSKTHLFKWANITFISKKMTPYCGTGTTVTSNVHVILVNVLIVLMNLIMKHVWLTQQ